MKIATIYLKENRSRLYSLFAILLFSTIYCSSSLAKAEVFGDYLAFKGQQQDDTNVYEGLVEAKSYKIAGAYLSYLYARRDHDSKQLVSIIQDIKKIAKNNKLNESKITKSLKLLERLQTKGDLLDELMFINAIETGNFEVTDKISKENIISGNDPAFRTFFDTSLELYRLLKRWKDRKLTKATKKETFNKSPEVSDDDITYAYKSMLNLAKYWMNFELDVYNNQLPQRPEDLIVEIEAKEINTLYYEAFFASQKGRLDQKQIFEVYKPISSNPYYFELKPKLKEGDIHKLISPKEFFVQFSRLYTRQTKNGYFMRTVFNMARVLLPEYQEMKYQVAQTYGLSLYYSRTQAKRNNLLMISLLNQITEDNPLHLDALNVMAHSYLTLTEFQQAISIINKIKKIYPSAEDKILLLEYKLNYLFGRSYEKSIPVLKRMIDLNVNPPYRTIDKPFLLADAYVKSGRVLDGMDMIVELIKSNAPNRQQLFLYYAHLLIETTSEYELALEYLIAVRGDHKMYAIYDKDLGYGYFKAGDYDKALEILETAVIKTPADPKLNEYLGDLYFKIGRKKEAIYQWQKSKTYLELYAGSNTYTKPYFTTSVHGGLPIYDTFSIPKLDEKINNSLAEIQ